MANKPTKPLKIVNNATPTKEEMELKRIAYFAQRREGIAVHILGSLIRGRVPGTTKAGFKEYVDLSVDLTDQLLEKLYPKPEDKK